MDFSVYCDESRHTGGKGSRFAVIGSLWIRSDHRDELSKALRRIKTSEGAAAEVKWSKTSKLKIEAYKALVAKVFECNAASFRAIVIDQNRVNYADFHQNDEELGFYKFYYEMLEKWVVQGNQYTILLDQKNNSESDRLTKLKEFLKNYAKPRGAVIHDLTSINSQESHIAQICDLITGAVAADANGVEGGTPKAHLIEYIRSLRKTSKLSSPSSSPEVSKFNIFRIALGG